jgi:serine/threonine protein kinase
MRSSIILTNIKILKFKGSNVAVKKLQRAYTQDQAMMEQLESEWQRELQAHRMISKYGHANIIKFMAAITRNYERYLMFEWANGGNLRQFWVNEKPHLTRRLVKDVIGQLHGLASALSKIHFNKLRHGDLKPENILRVKNSGNQSSGIDIGTLKICDMGLTKYHDLATQLRQGATNTYVFPPSFISSVWP